MPKRLKSIGFVTPTPDEDEAIAKGIAQDPDTFEVPSEKIAQMRPRGRPRLERPKELVTMRLDADVVEALRARGEGWQTRANRLLKEAVNRVDVNEEQDVRYWTRALGVTPEQLRKAVAKVGDRAEKVRGFLAHGT